MGDRKNDKARGKGSKEIEVLGTEPVKPVPEPGSEPWLEAFSAFEGELAKLVPFVRVHLASIENNPDGAWGARDDLDDIDRATKTMRGVVDGAIADLEKRGIRRRSPPRPKAKGSTS